MAVTVLSRNNQSINSSHMDSSIYNIQDRINPPGYTIIDNTSTMMYTTFYDDLTIFNMTTNKDCFWQQSVK